MASSPKMSPTASTVAHSLAPTTSPSPAPAQAPDGGTSTTTVAAVVLVVAGALLILGGSLYAWLARRHLSPSIRFLNPNSSETRSIASWHGVPDSAPLWLPRGRLHRQNPASYYSHAYSQSYQGSRSDYRRHSLDAEYIPYRGPIEPPRLPLPAALRGMVDRPLPPLPPFAPSASASAHPAQARSSFAAHMDVRADSFLSDASNLSYASMLSLPSIPSMHSVHSVHYNGFAKPSVATATNGRRSVARLLPTSELGNHVNDLKTLSRSGSTSKAARTRSTQLLKGRHRSAPYYHLGSDTSLSSLLSPRLPAAAVLRRATTSSRSRKRWEAFETEYPFEHECPFSP